jgi:hypothetical protein
MFIGLKDYKGGSSRFLYVVVFVSQSIIINQSCISNKIIVLFPKIESFQIKNNVSYMRIPKFRQNFCNFQKTDHNIRILITITDSFQWYFTKSDLGPGQIDHISGMITLSVITLSGFHCIW